MDHNLVDQFILEELNPRRTVTGDKLEDQAGKETPISVEKVGRSSSVAFLDENEPNSPTMDQQPVSTARISDATDVLRAPGLHFEWADPSYDATAALARGRRSSVAPSRGGSIAQSPTSADSLPSASIQPILAFSKDKNDVTQRTAFIENSIRRRVLEDVMGRDSQWLVVAKKEPPTAQDQEVRRLAEGQLELGGGNINTSNGATAVGLFESKEALAARLATEYRYGGLLSGATVSAPALLESQPLRRDLSQSALMTQSRSNLQSSVLAASAGRTEGIIGSATNNNVSEAERQRAHQLQIQHENKMAQFMATISMGTARYLPKQQQQQQQPKQFSVSVDTFAQLEDSSAVGSRVDNSASKDRARSIVDPSVIFTSKRDGSVAGSSVVVSGGGAGAANGRRQRKVVVFSEEEDLSAENAQAVTSFDGTMAQSNSIDPTYLEDTPRPKTPLKPRDIHLSHRSLLNFMSLGKPKKWSDHRFDKAATRLREALDTQFDLFYSQPAAGQTDPLAAFVQKHKAALAPATSQGNFAMLEARRALATEAPPAPLAGGSSRNTFLAQLVNGEVVADDRDERKPSLPAVPAPPTSYTSKGTFADLIEFVTEAQHEIQQLEIEDQIAREKQQAELSTSQGGSIIPMLASTACQRLQVAKPAVTKNTSYKYDRLIHENNNLEMMDLIIDHYAFELDKAAANKRSYEQELAEAAARQQSQLPGKDHPTTAKRGSMAPTKASKIIHKPDDPKWAASKKQANSPRKTGGKKKRRKSKKIGDDSIDNDSSDEGDEDVYDLEIARLKQLSESIAAMADGEVLTDVERRAVVRVMAVRKGDDTAAFVPRASPSPVYSNNPLLSNSVRAPTTFVSTGAFGDALSESTSILASNSNSPKLRPSDTTNNSKSSTVTRTASGFGGAVPIASRRPSLAQPISRFDESLVFDEKDVLMTDEERMRLAPPDSFSEDQVMESEGPSRFDRSNSTRRGQGSMANLSYAAGARGGSTLNLPAAEAIMAASVESYTKAGQSLSRQQSNVGVLKSVAGSTVSLLGGNYSTSVRADMASALLSKDPNSRFHVAIAPIAPQSWLSRAYDASSLLPYKTSRGAGAGASVGEEAEEGMVAFGNMAQPPRTTDDVGGGTAFSGSSSQLLKNHCVPSMPSKHFTDALQWLADATTLPEVGSASQGGSSYKGQPALARRKAAALLKRQLALLLLPTIEETGAKECNTTTNRSPNSRTASLAAAPSGTTYADADGAPLAAEDSLGLILHWLDGYNANKKDKNAHNEARSWSLAASDFCVVPIEARDEVAAALKARGIPTPTPSKVVEAGIFMVGDVQTVPSRKGSSTSTGSSVLDLGATRKFVTKQSAARNGADASADIDTEPDLPKLPSVVLSEVAVGVDSGGESSSDDDVTNFDQNKIIRGRQILLAPNAESADAIISKAKALASVDAAAAEVPLDIPASRRRNKHRYTDPIAVLEYGVDYYLKAPQNTSKPGLPPATTNKVVTSPAAPPALQITLNPETEKDVDYEDLIDHIEFKDYGERFSESVSTLRGTVDRALAAELEREEERKRQEAARWAQLLAQFIKQMEAVEVKARTDIERDEKNERFGPLEQSFSEFTLALRTMKEQEVLWRNLNKLTDEEEPLGRSQLLMWEHRVFTGLEDVELRARGMTMSTVKHVIIFPAFSLCSPEVNFYQSDVIRIVFDDPSEIVESVADVREGLMKSPQPINYGSDEGEGDQTHLLGPSFRPSNVFLHSLVCKGMLDIAETDRLREGDGYGIGASSDEGDSESRDTGGNSGVNSVVNSVSGGATPTLLGLPTLSRKSLHRRSTATAEKDALAAMALMTDLEEAQYREALRRESRISRHVRGGMDGGSSTSGGSRSPSISMAGSSRRDRKREKHLKLMDQEEVFLTDEMAIGLVLGAPTPPPSPRKTSDQSKEDSYPTLRILRPEEVVGKGPAAAMEKLIQKQIQAGALDNAKPTTAAIHPLTLLLETELQKIRKLKIQQDLNVKKREEEERRERNDALRATTQALNPVAVCAFDSIKVPVPLLPASDAAHTTVSRVASTNARETDGKTIGDSPLITHQPSIMPTEPTPQVTPRAAGRTVSGNTDKIIYLKPRGSKDLSPGDVPLPMADLKTSGAMSTSALVGSLKDEALSVSLSYKDGAHPRLDGSGVLNLSAVTTSSPAKKKIESVAAKRARLERERLEAEAFALSEAARLAEEERAAELEATMSGHFAGGEAFFETARVNEEELAARARRQKLEAYQAKAAERKARKLLGASGSGSMMMSLSNTASPSPRLATGRPQSQSGLDGVVRALSSNSHDGRRLSVDSMASLRHPGPSHWLGMSGSPLQSGMNSALPTPGRGAFGPKPPLAPHFYSHHVYGNEATTMADGSVADTKQRDEFEEAAEFDAILSALRGIKGNAAANNNASFGATSPLELSISSDGNKEDGETAEVDAIEEDVAFSPSRRSQSRSDGTDRKSTSKPVQPGNHGTAIKSKHVRDRTSSMNEAIKAHYEQITAEAIANTFPTRAYMLHSWRFKPFGATVVSLMKPTRQVLQRLIERGGIRLQEDAESRDIVKTKSSGNYADVVDDNIWWKVVTPSANERDSLVIPALAVSQFSQGRRAKASTRTAKLRLEMPNLQKPSNQLSAKQTVKQPDTSLDPTSLIMALRELVSKPGGELSIVGSTAPTWSTRLKTTQERLKKIASIDNSDASWQLTVPGKADDLFTSTFTAIRPFSTEAGVVAPLLPKDVTVGNLSIGSQLPTNISQGKPPKPAMPKSNPFTEETVLRDAPFFPHFLPRTRPITSNATAATSAAVRLQEASKKEKEVRTAVAQLVSANNDDEIVEEALIDLQKEPLTDGVPTTHLTPMEVVGADRRGPRSFLTKGTLSARDDLTRIMGAANVGGRSHSTSSRKQYVARAANALLPPISPSLVAPLVKLREQAERDRIAASKAPLATMYGPEVGSPLRTATPSRNMSGTVTKPSRLRPLSQGTSIKDALLSAQLNQSDALGQTSDERDSLRIHSMSVSTAAAKLATTTTTASLVPPVETTVDGNATFSSSTQHAPSRDITTGRRRSVSRNSLRRSYSASVGSFRSVGSTTSANIACVKPTTQAALRSAVSSSVHLKAEQFALRHSIDRAADVQRDLLKLLEGLRWDMMR